MHMFKLKYTSPMGESIELYGRPFRLMSVEGLGDVEADNQMQKAPFQDGYTYIDSVLESRPITIELKITGSNFDEVTENRRMLSSLFNPKLGAGKLEYIGNDHKVIGAVAESIPFFPDGSANRGETFQKALINLTCPSPYWQSDEITEEPAFIPLFTFPFEGAFQMGLQRDERIIFNDGDAPAPLQVVFYGPADRPTIKNVTTGEYITINKRLEENEKLIVDTSDGNKSLYYEDENGERTDVFHWIDLNSTFFDLQLGENHISCLCVISNLTKDFEVYYSKLYAGV